MSVGDHDHGDAHGHHHDDAGPSKSLWARIAGLVSTHSHDTADRVDPAMKADRRGMKAVVVSLIGLGLTAGLQAIVVVVSGSVALLGDTMHNAADALTAVPLAIAFTIGRRAASRRYTYGFGRAEDLAGVVIVLTIVVSSAAAAIASVQRLIHPSGVSHLPLVAAAALIGFAGNELVARYRISVGRQIGSAALVADGLHARSDGFTSLAVLLGVGGVALGLPWADPVVGVLITLAILVVLRGAAREVYARLMDAVDPALVDSVEQALRATDGVRDVGDVRLRWIGHELRAECEVVVDPLLTVVQGHAIAHAAEHALLHQLPRLTAALVHADPLPVSGIDHHELMSHHGRDKHTPLPSDKPTEHDHDPEHDHDHQLQPDVAPQL